MDRLWGERGCLSKGKGGPGNRAAHAHRAREWEESALQRHLSFHRHSEFNILRSRGGGSQCLTLPVIRLRTILSVGNLVSACRDAFATLHRVITVGKVFQAVDGYVALTLQIGGVYTLACP